MTFTLVAGCLSSTPIIDQVPEDMQTKLSLCAGTAATAEAVSCEAALSSGMRPQPTSPAISSLR